MSKKKNIVIINPDQLRWDYITPAGHPFIGTKNLLRLSELGCYFKNAFTSCPMCGPSRISFITGQYPIEHQSRNYGGEMNPEKPNILTQLKHNGYYLGLFGKDHNVPMNAIGVLYDEGEDICIGNMDNHPDYKKSYSSGVLEKNSIFDLTDRLTTGGLNYIDKMQNRGNPFFVSFNYQDPHPYFTCPEPYSSLFKPDQFELPESFHRNKQTWELLRLKNWRIHSESMTATSEDFKRAMAKYCGQIRYVDDQVGRILDKLQELNILKDTIVIFWSDHGEFLGDFGVTHKGAMFYDVLIRIPLIIFDPEKRIPKKREQDLVEAMDTMATVMDLVGIERLPFSKAQSLVNPDYKPRKDVYAEGGLYAKQPKIPWENHKLKAPGNPTQWGPAAMLRNNDFKLCWYAEEGGEMYDLRIDPNENNNVFNDKEYLTISKNLLERLISRTLCLGEPPEWQPSTEQEVKIKNKQQWNSTMGKIE